MKAVIIKETGKAEMADIKPQSMRPNYIRVKTVALALNPSKFPWEREKYNVEKGERDRE